MNFLVTLSIRNLAKWSQSWINMSDACNKLNLRPFLLAWFLLPVIKYMIRAKGFRWTCQKIHDNPFNELPIRNESISANQVEIANSIHKSVLQAGRYWPHKRNNCLQRASVGCFLIRAKNIPCCIKLGFKGNNSESLETAHAWIEVLGQPIGESRHALKNFKPFNHCSKANG